MTKSSVSDSITKRHWSNAFVYILQRALIGPSAPAGFYVYIVIKRGDDSSDFPYTTTMTLPDCSDLGRPE